MWGARARKFSDFADLWLCKRSGRAQIGEVGNLNHFNNLA